MENNQKSTKIFEMFAERLEQPVDKCLKDFGNDLIKKYGNLYNAFEECAYDRDTLKNDGFTGDWLKTFDDISKENITIPFVTIKGLLTITTWAHDGINHIRDALIQVEESEYEDVEIKVKYIGAPRYLVTVRAPDYKVAEEQMKKAVTRVTECIEKHDGESNFTREVEE